MRTPSSKKLVLANRSSFGDKAAANGSGIRQNNSNRRRRAGRRRSSHAQFTQSRFRRFDDNRRGCWLAQSAQRKTSFHYSRSDAAENARTGDLQDSKKRSCDAADSNHEA